MTTPQRIAEQIAVLRAEVRRVVTGYDEVVEDLLIGLVAQGHILLEGVPGIAKTTLAKTFAHASGLGFRRVQFTQDLLPADITGHWFYNQKAGDFELRKGPVFSNFLLADEINRAPPKTQSALLESMEERQVTIEGRTFPLEKPFMVVATMNPIDVEGVYRLPEAQLDRFLIRTQMGYLPQEKELEMLLSKRTSTPDSVKSLDPKLILDAQAFARTVRTEPEVVAYLQAIALATRADPAITLGASPRAMEQMLHAARAVALLDGRDYVIPDDVKHVAPKTLNHRILLHVDAEIEGKTTASVVADAIARVDVPKGGATSTGAPPPRPPTTFSLAR